MKSRNAIIKLTIFLFVSVSLSILAVHSATATEGVKGQKPPCPMMHMGSTMSEEMMQAHNQFVKESRELRKSLMVKKAEMKALMHNANPNSEQVALLAGELFDLKEKLAYMAHEFGLPAHSFMGSSGKGCGGCGHMKKCGGPMHGKHHGMQ